MSYPTTFPVYRHIYYHANGAVETWYSRNEIDPGPSALPEADATTRDYADDQFPIVGDEDWDAGYTD